MLSALIRVIRKMDDGSHNVVMVEAKYLRDPQNPFLGELYINEDMTNFMSMGQNIGPRALLVSEDGTVITTVFAPASHPYSGSE